MKGGRGRKRQREYRRGSITFYLSTELTKEIKREAKNEGLTPSDFVAEILTKELQGKEVKTNDRTAKNDRCRGD